MPLQKHKLMKWGVNVEMQNRAKMSQIDAKFFKKSDREEKMTQEWQYLQSLYKSVSSISASVFISPFSSNVRM